MDNKINNNLLKKILYVLIYIIYSTVSNIEESERNEKEASTSNFVMDINDLPIIHAGIVNKIIREML